MIPQRQNRQKSVERDFNESQQKLFFLMQRHPCPVIEWNTAFAVTEWNNAAERLFGYSKSEVLGTHIAELIVPESDKGKIKNIMQALLHQEGGDYSLNQNLTKDGAVIVCEWCNRPVIDCDGRVISIVSMVQDVTQTQCGETAVQKDEQIYQQILDSLADMVLVKAAKSRIVWANKAFRDYYGMTNEQLTDIIDAPFNEPHLTQQYIKDDAYVFETGQTLEIPEEPATRYDGEVRLFHTVKSAIRNAAGEVVMTVGVSRDISERKTAQKALRQFEVQLQHKAQDLEQTLQELQRTQTQLFQSDKMSSLGQLVAGVAHEINNPTSFIYSNIEPAKDYIQDLLKLIQLYQEHYPDPAIVIQDELEAIDLEFLMADLPKLLSSIKMGAERIKQIVLSLRNFSRMDDTEFKSVDIHAGIDSTLVILEHRLKAQHNRLGIQVIKEYSNLPLVECYPGQLNQVFMNILVNALYALEERDERRSIAEMRQKPSTIRIRTEISENNQVVIRIADNASGIPKDVQKRLFDPFFTTKPVGKGTGMGLSISYQIVTEKHGGSLECISTLGEGTEFAIALPLCQRP
ncbi:PAS/PAC sensor signal transduction histidine kinase [Cylindrospermum sp. NIES-4074]|nr:PAS/PAC sensor signal transduction histidine kinase [Cylindrospermum sp. NIES-4074]